jgi:hypothetical protein
LKRRIAVIQSSYLPWRGYFDIIHDVDEFIFYDDVQFTKQDWRTRNRIYSSQGVSWISLPCGSNLERKINEVKLPGDIPWGKQQWDKIRNAYRKAPYFGKYKDFFANVFLEYKWEYLSQLNQYFITTISRDFLKIPTKFSNSTDYQSFGKKNEKLLSLIKNAGCEVYISGPAAKNYINEDDYKASGISIEWKDYSGYPEYPQNNTPFEPNVSIIDLLFHIGPDAPFYIWGWRLKNQEES